MAFLLGWIGFASREKGLDGPYRALQLFVLESGSGLDQPGSGLDQPVPMTLQVARFLAPMVAAWAIVAAVLSLFRDQLRLARVRLFARNHVAVVGLGDKGSRLVRTLHDAGLPVVVIERQQVGAPAEGCRERGVVVVQGNATDPRVLRRARVDRARHLVVLCGDDSNSINVAFAAAALPRPRGACELSALVHLEDLGLWHRLGAEALLIRDRLGLRPFFFNTVDLAARQIAEEECGLSDRGAGAPGQPHVVIVGLGELTERLVLHFARSWQNYDHRDLERLRITLGGHGAEALSRALMRQHPKLGSLCDLTAHEVDLTATELDCAELLRTEAGGCEATSAYVNCPARPRAWRRRFACMPSKPRARCPSC